MKADDLRSLPLQVRDPLYRYCSAVNRGDAPFPMPCHHQVGTDDHGFIVGRRVI